MGAALAACLLAVVGLGLCESLSGAQTISPEVLVSNGYLGYQDEPSVAALGDRAVCVAESRVTIAGGIGWWFSGDGGQIWTNGGQMPTTPETGQEGQQPTICVDNAGHLYAAALSQVTQGYLWGYTVSFWRGTFQGAGVSWQPEQSLVPGALDSGTPYERPWLECDPDRGYLYLAYTFIHSYYLGGDHHEMTIYFMRSLDGGATWSAPQPLSSGTCNGSRPAVGPDGELYVVWEDFGTRQVLGRKSTDFGASFGSPFVVAPILDNLATPPSGWWAPSTRYNPIYPKLDRVAGPNFPAIAIDRSSGIRRGTVYVAWADYAEGALSPQTGTTIDSEPNDWYVNANPFTVGDDIQGFMLSGDFGVQDCDRYTFVGTAGTTVEISGELTYVSPGNKDGSPSTAGYAVLCGADTTQLTQVALPVFQESWAGSLPPFIYTFPSTQRYYLNMICGGANNIGYRLHTRVLNVAPGSAARDFRDIVLVSSGDGGATWSSKRRVNDDAPQFDNAMPSLAVDGQGAVQAAWYDRRDEPLCGALVHTYWAESMDGGVTFHPSRRLSGQLSSWAIYAASYSNIGDHLAVESSGDRTWVLWTDTRGMPGDRADIYAATIQAEPPTAVAVSGFRTDIAGGRVELDWLVGDASGVTGFRLWRAADGAYSTLGPDLIAVHGEGTYREPDATASPGTRYQYRLEVIHSDGASTWLGPLEAELPIPADRLAWEEVAPNPFAESVRLTVAVPRPGEGAVRVYDLLGHEVATLERGAWSAGRQALAWDGRDRGGRLAPSGVYLLRAELGTEHVTRRIVHIR